MTAALASLSPEERIGLGAAAVLHVALAWLLISQRSPPEPIPEPERIVVSLAEDVSLVNAAPNPSTDPAAAVAPTLTAIPAPESSPQRSRAYPSFLTQYDLSSGTSRARAARQ